MKETKRDEHRCASDWVQAQQDLASPSIERVPSYGVILHNDEQNTRDYVADTVCKVTSLKPFESHQKMLEADESGVACLLVTDKEKAEHYRDQLVSKGLCVTIEPAESIS